LRLRVCFVTYPSRVPWCSNFIADALKRFSKHDVFSLPADQLKKAGRPDVIHFHNIQLIKNINVNRLKPSKIIAGVRGRMGLKLKHRIRELDAVSVNVDPYLSQEVAKLHPHTRVLPSGADPELFSPPDSRPAQFTVGWVGRDHKKFKNADLLPLLGFPFRKATYRNYIPHHEMPRFYHSCSVIAIFSDHEGLCRPMLEGAMTALPIVSSNVGLASEILDDDWIIHGNPRQSIAEYRRLLTILKEDESLAAEVGRENRRRAMKYDWRNVVPLYDALWEEVA